MASYNIDIIVSCLRRLLKVHTPGSGAYLQHVRVIESMEQNLLAIEFGRPMESVAVVVL